MALLQLLLILTPTSVSLPSVNLSPPLSAVASSLPLPRSEACICQHHITLHLGVSKHACDMTQRNTPVENILLREHMGRAPPSPYVTLLPDYNGPAKEEATHMERSL